MTVTGSHIHVFRETGESEKMMILFTSALILVAPFAGVLGLLLQADRFETNTAETAN